MTWTTAQSAPISQTQKSAAVYFLELLFAMLRILSMEVALVHSISI
jgi:hypothetical protein